MMAIFYVIIIINPKYRSFLNKQISQGLVQFLYKPRHMKSASQEGFLSMVFGQGIVNSIQVGIQAWGLILKNAKTKKIVAVRFGAANAALLLVLFGFVALMKSIDSFLSPRTNFENH